MSIDLQTWAWATDGQIPGFCLTFTRRRGPQDVVAAYGADPDLAAVMTATEAASTFPIDMAGALLRTGSLGSWAFCYEDRAPEGIKPNVLRRLSADTETIEVVKGGDGMNTVKYFRDGRRIESFEPTERATLRGDGPYQFLPLVEEFLVAHPGVLDLNAALCVIGGHIGAQLDVATRDGPLLTAFLADSDREPRLAGPAPQTSRADPRLGASVGTLDPAILSNPEPARKRIT